MADQVEKTIDTAADEAKAATKTAGEAAKAAVNTGETAAKVQAETAKKAASKTTRRAKAQKPRRAAPKANQSQANERNDDVNFNSNNFFNAIPAASPFQAFFADAGERGQETLRRSQQAAEEIAELTRCNVEALVESGRIAAEGARSIGQELVDSNREGIEQAADAVRSLAEAKSATEFVQLQGQFARASFDRVVAESSRLTESFVKLAGEAFRPISNRASENAERLNQIVA